MRPKARSCTLGKRVFAPFPEQVALLAAGALTEPPGCPACANCGTLLRMTLYDPSCTRKITKRPFAEHRRLLEQRLSAEEYQAVCDHIDALIDGAGKEIVTAGWLPGSDWSGTPLMPIYTKAARHDQELAGKLFGLLVYLRIMDHEDDWGSGRYQVDGRDINSRTYFRINFDRS